MTVEKKLLLRRLPLIITEKFESRGIFEELDKLENVKNHKKSYLIRGCIINWKEVIKDCADTFFDCNYYNQKMYLHSPL